MERFHFPMLHLHHFPLCLTGVQPVLLASYDTANVVPYIQECLISGIF